MLALPEQWWFKHDPQDAGVKEGWYAFAPIPAYEWTDDPAVSVSYPTMPGWGRQSTETSWQTTETDYQGYNWYRTQVQLPQDLAGGKVRLLVTGVFGHMDFFVNGQRMTWTADVPAKDGPATQEQVNHLDLGTAWSWNYNETIDLPVDQYLKPGAVNTFAFRTRDVQHWGGIFKRAQLYVPFVDPPRPTQPAKHCDCSR